MVALIARAMGWGGEAYGRPFADQGGVDGELWRNVATPAHYGVAKGYNDGNGGTYSTRPPPSCAPRRSPSSSAR